MSNLILHNYFRSSTSIRVRAALNLKGLDFEYRSYHLRKGEQRSSNFLDLNAQGLVPALELPEDTLTQSLAIIEFLDESYPEPRLMPTAALERARVRSLALLIGCEIHPLNNLRVLAYLSNRFDAQEDAVRDWFVHWVEQSFEPLEKRLNNETDTGRFCHGDTPSIADLCLFSQVVNNRRFDVDMSPYPKIKSIFEACMELKAFEDALPQNQPDSE